MHSVVTPLFGKAKLKLTQTPRAVTPFGGLASFIGFLEQRGFVGQAHTHLSWELTSPNAIPLAHTFTALVIGVFTGARRFAHTELARSDRSLQALLDIARWPGADTVRGLFHRFTQGTMQSFWRPSWRWLLGWSLVRRAASRWIWIRGCSNGRAGNKARPVATTRTVRGESINPCAHKPSRKAIFFPSCRSGLK